MKYCILVSSNADDAHGSRRDKDILAPSKWIAAYLSRSLHMSLLLDKGIVGAAWPVAGNIHNDVV